MFGLLSTIFLVGLCCSSVINNTLDHKQADNEISYHEKAPLNIGYYADSDYRYFYMDEYEFQSIEFISTFIESLSISNTIFNDFSIGSTNNAETQFLVDSSLTYFTNYNGDYFPNTVPVMGTISSIKFSKSFVGTESYTNYNDVNVFRYYFTFEFSDSSVMVIYYTIVSPMSFYQNYSSTNLYYLVDYSYAGGGSWTNYHWCYRECRDVSLGAQGASTPLMSYYYDYKVRQLENLEGTWYNNGYNNGYDNGYDDGNNHGYQLGYATAVQEYAEIDTTAASIFTGILEVGLLPVNVFLQFMNFELFGINIAGLVSSLITVALVIIILRFIFGGKNHDK